MIGERQNFQMGSCAMTELNSVNLTKADISEAVYREIGLSKTESYDLANSVLDHISNALIRGENVKLTKFGMFKLNDKNERPGRNPKTGEPAVIQKRRVVKFRPAKQFSSRVDTALKRKPSKTYRTKEDLLGLLSDKLRCEVDDVRFLFEASEQAPSKTALEIPDRRFHT